MSAHVQVSACVHEHYAEVSFLVHRLAQESAEHIVVSARLKHQSGTNLIVVLLHPFLLLNHSVALRLWETTNDDTAELSDGMGVNYLQCTFETTEINICFQFHNSYTS